MAGIVWVRWLQCGAKAVLLAGTVLALVDQMLDSGTGRGGVPGGGQLLTNLSGDQPPRYQDADSQQGDQRGVKHAQPDSLSSRPPVSGALLALSSALAQHLIVNEKSAAVNSLQAIMSNPILW